MKIYHNPRCRKSRETLGILDESGVEVEVVEYLKNPISADELKAIVQKLGIEPEQLIRKSEAIYKSDYKGKQLTNADWYKAMVKHPILIERPIVLTDQKAIIGRPPQKVLELL